MKLADVKGGGFYRMRSGAVVRIHEPKVVLAGKVWAWEENAQEPLLTPARDLVEELVDPGSEVTP